MTAARPRSQCAVALLADIPGTGHLGDAQAHRFTLAGSDLATRCAEFIDFAKTSVDAGHKVLALYPEWRATTALRAIRFARGGLGSDHIAAIGLNVSPLTLSLLADQLAYLAPYLPAGMVASMARELPKHLVSGGWLRSVTKLDTLPTSFSQHLGSYSPGAAFLAVCAPEPRVVRVRNEDATAGIPSRPVDPVQVLLAAPPSVDTAPFDDRLRPALRPESVRSLPEQPLGSAFFGTAKYLEFVALSAHPAALTQAVHNVRATPCGWCREPTNAPTCRFCGAANAQPASQQPTTGQRRPPAPVDPRPFTPAPAHPNHHVSGPVQPAVSPWPAQVHHAQPAPPDHPHPQPVGAQPAHHPPSGPHRTAQPWHRESGPSASPWPAESTPVPPAAPPPAHPASAPSWPAHPGHAPPVEASDAGGLPLMAPSGQFRSEPMRPAEISTFGPPPPATDPPDDPLPDPTPLPPETGTR